MSNVPNRYVGIEFPPYEFKEFPKWVKDSEGQDVIVQNAEEEAKVAGKAAATVNKPAGK